PSRTVRDTALGRWSDRAAALFVEEQHLVERHRERLVLARPQARLDRQLHDELMVAEPKVPQLLVGQILHDLDRRAPAARSRTAIAELHVLRTETHELPGAPHPQHSCTEAG